MAREHYENFPVASWLLPPQTRDHIAAIYAFARTADDFADEGERPAAERLSLLEDWRRRLHAATDGHIDRDGSRTALIFTALGETIRACNLEVQLFDDLLSAFRQDVTTTRYETWESVLDYCRRSADPVGRLVLRVAGYRDDVLDAQSDAVCTALQLTNFWQDIERDWQKGRVYVPTSLIAAAGADEQAIARGQLSPEWKAILRDVTARTRALFERGKPVADGVHGRLRWELRATWLGGVRILDRIQAVDFDVFRARPTLGWGDAAAVGWRVLRW